MTSVKLIEIKTDHEKSSSRVMRKRLINYYSEAKWWFNSQVNKSQVQPMIAIVFSTLFWFQFGREITNGAHYDHFRRKIITKYACGWCMPSLNAELLMMGTKKIQN